MDIALDVSGILYDIGFQNFYTVHCDIKGTHIHFCLNSINHQTGNRMKNSNSFYSSISRYVNNEYPYIHINKIEFEQKQIWKYDNDGTVNGGYYIDGIHNRMQ